MQKSDLKEKIVTINLIFTSLWCK